MLWIGVYTQGQSSWLLSVLQRNWHEDESREPQEIQNSRGNLSLNTPSFTFPAVRMCRQTESLDRNNGGFPPCLKLGAGVVVMGISGPRQQLNWLCQLLSITDEHMQSFIKPLIFQWIGWDCGQELPQVHPLVLSYQVLPQVLNGFSLVFPFWILFLFLF